MTAHTPVNFHPNCLILARIARIAVCVITLLLMMQPREAAAGLVVSNIGNINVSEYLVFSLNNDQDWQNVANSFTTGANAQILDSVTIFYGGSPQNGGNGGFRLSLYSDLLGLPGTDLGVIFSGPDQPSGALTQYVASAYLLNPNTTYWLMASEAHTGEPGKIQSWRVTNDLSETGDPGWSIGTSAFQAYHNGNLDSWIVDPSVAQLFSVQTTAVPEPSTALLSSLAGLAGLAFRWNKNRKVRNAKT